ncbi:hypothetical protein [Pseudanabaena yagii]|uniref:Uncharacterized protein n=1 Tax=Pseudanabaena yagii GIHE-NHR1 TaxID=2722753 RepID=A0ABX1LW12_9CYAN|nr:hypothetical protein [Pseudanabaena yagii]NMF60368.1 hypothetical protein [Pseudanabaena yagii GIHE-NHR1]
MVRTAIAPYHPQNPIAYFSKSISDLPSPPNTRSPIPHIKQRSHHTIHKPDRLSSSMLI